jgi:hypothetical protein
MLPVELWEPNLKSSSLPVDKVHVSGSEPTLDLVSFNYRHTVERKI